MTFPECLYANRIDSTARDCRVLEDYLDYKELAYSKLDEDYETYRKGQEAWDKKPKFSGLKFPSFGL